MSTKFSSHYFYRRLSQLLLSGCICLPAPPLSAQTAGAGRVLETLVVRGQAPSAALTAGLVRRDLVQNLPGSHLDASDLVRGLPGLQIDQRSNFAQDNRLSLRGYGARSAFGVRGIRLLVDAVPLTQADGQGQLSSPLSDGLEAVELLSGPLAGIYGGGAGGVLSLSSRAPESRAVQLDLTTGSVGLQRQALGASGRWGDLGAELRLARASQTGERPHSELERHQWGMRLEYQTQGDLHISLKHEQTDDPLLQDPLSLTPAQWRDNPLQLTPLAERFNTRKSVRHRQSSLSFNQTLGDWRWQLASWQGERDIVQYLAFSGAALSSSGGVVDLRRDFAGASASLARDFSLAGESFSWSLGGDWAQMDDRRRGYVNNLGERGELRRNELGQVQSRAVFSLLEWRGQGRWSAFAGVRREQHDFSVDDYLVLPAQGQTPANPDDSGVRDYTNNAWALGTSYQLSDSWRLGASSGSAGETPTLSEMAYSADSSGMNTQLQSARSNQQQLNLDYGSGASERQLRLSLFNIHSRDELLVGQSINGRTIYANAAATRRRGLELWGRWSLNRQWQLQATATALSAEFAEGTLAGKHLPGVAERLGQLQLDFLPFASDRLRLMLIAQGRSAVAADDANQIEAPGFASLDFALEGALSPQLNWWLKLANLSDRQYVGSVVVNQSSGRAFEPGNGRSWSLGLNWQLL